MSPTKEPAQTTIDGLAKRDDKGVMWIATSFAIGGALMDIGAHAISAILKSPAISMLWGIWIPLCFITIPPIHYLCRHLQRLQARLDALESQLAERSAK